MAFLLDSLYCKDESFQDLIWEKEELDSLLSKEEENHMCDVVINNPFLSVFRKEAIEWILEAVDFHNFSAQTAILAVNYLDRFLFSLKSQSEKPWMNQLAAVTCLSLAAKIEETQVPLLLDLQVCSKQNGFFLFSHSMFGTHFCFVVLTNLDSCRL